MTMLIKVFLLAFTLQNPCCQDSIYLEMLDKEIYVKRGETVVTFNLRVINRAEDNLLLYNFNNKAELAFEEESFFCNDEIAAGATIFVYNLQMEAINAVIPPIPDEISYTHVTAERVQQVIEEEKVRFRTSLQVIRSGESISFQKTADLKHFKLSSGIYYLKFLYSTGDNSINMVSEDQMADDEKKYRAKVFKGSLRSNAVKLIIE